jgi:hypothetical protein
MTSPMTSSPFPLFPVTSQFQSLSPSLQIGTVARQGLNMAAQYIPGSRLQAAAKGVNMAGNLLGFGKGAGTMTAGGMSAGNKFKGRVY